MLKRDRQRVLTYVTGLLYFYGVIEATELYRMVSEQISVSVDRDKFKEILIEEAANEDSPYFFDVVAGYCHYLDVEDIHWVINEQTKRSSVKWRPVSEIEARYVVEEKYRLLWNAEEKAFYDYMVDEYDGEKDMTEALVADLQAHMRNDVPIAALVSQLAEELEIENTDELQQLTGRIVEFFNHSPQWALRGWSPREVRSQVNPASGNVVPFAKKTGRNDACPCGSGKKFKKCCMSGDDSPEKEAEAALTLTSKEYEALAIMTYIAEVVISGYDKGVNPEKSIFRETMNTVLRQAEKFGKEKIVSYFPEHDLYDLTRDMGDEGIAFEYIEKYEDNSFWDELANRLAKRDLFQKYGENQLRAMDHKEKFMKLQELEEAYNESFYENGLEGLELKKIP